MSTGEKSFTKGGRVRAPDLALICKWIMHVWQELDLQIIVHSFVKCCISSALDGSQDDVVWKDDITDSESSVDYESESDRDLNYNDADILTNEQMTRYLMLKVTLNLQDLNKSLNKCFCLNKSFALALSFVTQVRGAYYT